MTRFAALLLGLALGGSVLASCSSREVIGSSYREREAPAAGLAGSSVQPSEPGGGTAGAAGASTSGPTTGSSYDEPYRGQFHFSPPSLWMGNIDAIWFDAGRFHLAYQTDPVAFVQGKNEHWGHAISSDLLHWDQQPYMLVPDKNVAGEAWVGAVVVDVDNTAGLQTGPQPAYVAVLTATGAGTSLVYSNDQGRTWRPYANNPVAIGDPDYQTNRDPVVLWHAPTKRWVCAFWLKGITFYTSPDLKTWTQTGNIDWGALVPDLVELEVDGNAAERRWVLSDASGQYLIGSFDGQTFVKTSGPFAMDAGPNWGGARTSYRPTFPESRAVQLAWLRNGGFASAPARGEATFPVELGLRTFPEGVRLTRTPIAEIQGLYGATRHWDAQPLPQKQNLLDGIEAKTFDFRVELDATSKLPNEIRLEVAGKLVLYQAVDQTLLGQPLAPLDGKLTLRVLVDHGQLEVFANEGQLSYSESFPFASDDASVSFSADAPLRIRSADFRQLRRIWPGAAARSSRVIDDAAPEVRYSGATQAGSGDSAFVGDTYHLLRETGAAVELTFTGTRVAWYGLVNQDLGQADVYLDGALVAEAVDAYGSERRVAQLFSRQGLPETFHTLRVEATGRKNAASKGGALVHDYFISAVER